MGVSYRSEIFIMEQEVQEGMIHGDEKYPEKAVEHNDLKGMLLDEAGTTYRQTSLL